MILESIEGMEIVGVYDRGIANQERIVLAIKQTLNLGQYGLMIGVKAAAGTAFPLKDNLLWFGDGIVNQGDWLFVYTGRGQPKSSELPNSKSKLFSVHWGRDNTILHDNEIVPILFRVDAVQVPVEEQAKLLPEE